MDPKILSWNVRGLGSKDKMIIICKSLIGIHPDILVLQETKHGDMLDLIVKEVWGKPSNH